MSTQQQQVNNEQQKQQSRNSRKARRKGQSIYRGARMRKWGTWVSEIRIPHKRGTIWLGSYDSACKAALAYDFAAFCVRGRAQFSGASAACTVELGNIEAWPQNIQAAANHFAEQQHALCCNVGSKTEPQPAAATEGEKIYVTEVAATLLEGGSISISSDGDNSLGWE